MSLLHHVKPLLELHICKEYSMARKTNGTPSTRSKKTKATVETPEVQPVVEQATPEVRTELRRNVTPINVSPINVAAKKTSVDIEHEIRSRAYELYLERKGVAGDPSLDWIKAEREVRARYAGQNHSALAAGQGRI
jgi:hypothetical protein